MRKCVMGIDPGQKGAVAILSNDPVTVETWLLEHHPDQIQELIHHHVVSHIYVEKAQAMPKNGSVAMFNYGMGFGKILGWLEVLKAPFTLVPPRTWSKILHQGCTGKDAKAKSLQAVKRIFPCENLTPQGCRVPHMGLVDALLIAEYGRRVLV